MSTKPNVLVNLPPGFFAAPELKKPFARLAAMAKVTRRSHNTPEEISGDLAKADAVVMWSWPALTAELLSKAPRLKFAGHIDLSQTAARAELDHGLAVSVSRSGFSPAVSELALGLILSALRGIGDYHFAMRRGRETWVKAFPDDIPRAERELTGRSVGIVGFGRVGRRLAELLQAFGGEIRVFDPFVSAETAQSAGVLSVKLADLLRQSDVVVLAAASNAGTSHLIGPKQIALLRKNAVFVNVARAALVDTDALVRRLSSGDITAMIDVFDKEPLAKNHPLRRLPNAYLTPHRAGGVMPSVERIITFLVDDFKRHLAGEPLRHALIREMIPSLDA